MRLFTVIWIAVLAATAAACVRGLPEPVEAPRVVPGFDTREYPGDAVMEAWRADSPYRWVGYYLRSPCHTGTSWMGRRDALRQMGWGLAVIYVGEQDWTAAPSADADTAGARCTARNLTEARGVADAEDAERTVAAEGFPSGTTVYLDVERVDSVSPELASYVRAWTRRLLEGGRYVPAIYGHARNAEALFGLLAAEFTRQGVAARPRFWVASSGGFTLDAPPSASGFPFATVWQGLFDVRETWGGHTLRIDANVASSASPS